MTLDRRIREASKNLREAVTVHRPATFSSSFGAEDMVILDLIAKLELDVEVFTLDTGRLPAETHELIDRARNHYNRSIRVFHPDATELEDFVSRHGSNAFYNSIELRKQCCAIRKVAPLRRALKDKQLWITGMRKQQSVTRAELSQMAFDRQYGLFKFSPLIEWSTEEVFAYVSKHHVPVNALHEKGYPSIGCAPCTRAIEPGEDERAGRWWWEQADTRECGLHVDSSGRLVRAKNNATDAVASGRN